jgi:hypothetical protein
MLKNQLMKTAGLIVPLLLVMSCRKDKEVIMQQPVKTDVVAFERAYINTLNYSSDNSIRLIGYKKIKISPAELPEFTQLYENNKDKMRNYFYDEAEGAIRIYFPVEAALVENNNALTEASSIGELNVSNMQTDMPQLTIIGRKQTALVTGVEGNIIKDGIIYLSQKNSSDHHFGNTYVFDFGYKMMMSHDHHHGANAAMEKAACMNNHGGYRNCSTAFGIYMGRCTFVWNVCMDYNGWFTNCVNGKWSNFPGSDCDYALGSGHCWNEVM